MASEITIVNLWLIIGLSSLLLLGFITVIFFCVCWLRRVRTKNAQLYNIEELGCKNRSSFTFYRRFNSCDTNTDAKSTQDDNLVDSMDASNRFTSSLLRINSQVDEMRSCISTDSLGTFYSTGLSRNNSRRSRSFVSCSEGSEKGDMV